jgi:ABC-type multidrug transport system permease subunit
MQSGAPRRQDAAASEQQGLNAGENSMSAVQQFAGVAPPRVLPSDRHRSRYFLGMSIVLLVIALSGFSRTFFLRSLIPLPPLAPHIVVHGVLMTAWLVLLVVQTSLIGAHRTDLHRRLGVFGAVLALAVAVVALRTALGLPAHFKVEAAPNGVAMTPSAMIQIVWGNFATIALFCVFVAAAIGMRRRPEAHKRLLLLASIAMVGPAIGRYVADLARWSASTSVPAVVQALQILVAVLAIALPLSLVVHDLRTRRRVHPATAWGVGSYLLLTAGLQFGASATAAGRALILALQ